MEKGKIIVVEGACDGIGKTTQFELLKESLIESGKNVVYHHFPTYDTYHGSPVEHYLKGDYGRPEDLSPYFINNLYAVDRAIIWYTKLKEMYDSGCTILLDRYTTSSLIYQSACITNKKEKEKFLDFVADYEYNKNGINQPDIVIFLTAPFDLVTKMRNNRKDNDGVLNDIHEKDLNFMKKVYKSALFVCNYFGWEKIECNKGSKMKSIEEIHEEIVKILNVR
ncbi:MAG: thymidylate kinase [Bacilli bacterium]